MDESDAREHLEFRRAQLRQALEQIRTANVAERLPAFGSLEAAAPPAMQSTIQVPEAERIAAGGPAQHSGRFPSAADLVRQYESKQLSPSEVVEDALSRLARFQPSLNSFISVLEASAHAAAEQSTKRYQRAQAIGPLDGVPVSIKDVHVSGARTTAASRVRISTEIQNEDAPVVKRLRDSGAIILGKTNLDEYAYGASGDVSAFGPVTNPIDHRRISGGSSSGSAVAVAAGICPIAVGTDTGGSVRIPASLCGVVGLKPTSGRVSCQGVIPLSWSLDHVGPITRTVQDASVSLSVLSGSDAHKLASLVTRPSREPFRVGICRRHFFDLVDPEVRRAVEAAVASMGNVREVDMIHINVASAVALVVIAAEASAYHRAGVLRAPEVYSAAVRARLQIGMEIEAVDYLAALRARNLLRVEMEEALREIDVLAMPTTPIPAPLFGEKQVLVDGETTNPLALLIRNTAPINVTGFPSVSIPCGVTLNGKFGELSGAGVPQAHLLP
jgi:aspartyl-tRNA(Asn)/glutamyl-tRNA(Gln) amidotransferase subunit A